MSESLCFSFSWNLVSHANLFLECTVFWRNLKFSFNLLLRHSLQISCTSWIQDTFPIYLSKICYIFCSLSSLSYLSNMLPNQVRKKKLLRAGNNVTTGCQICSESPKGCCHATFDKARQMVSLGYKRLVKWLRPLYLQLNAADGNVSAKNE